ncbi:MAG TPA: uroporphyrinogen-III C-methyltransferase [Terriglobales bacterium]|jgi:uroporphyrin-III C-methyltransferase|nr:uroporphyrinogen-III C-methyltransferase [Terriglobales bacterium]
MNGKVYLIGAGPGDPELLTLRAHRLIREADVILHDGLVGPQILNLASAHALVRDVAKRCGRHTVSQDEINTQLIAFASFGLTVIRLKGGDPLVFGRAGEEIAALRRAGIEFEVVPGITAALSAAAALQISLTQRDVASSLVIMPGHHADDSSLDLRAFAAAPATFVVYMPGHDYHDIANRLLSADLDPSTPCAIVSRAMASDQQVHVTSIASLPDSPMLPAPSLLIVGEVVRSAYIHADTFTATRNAALNLPLSPNYPSEHQTTLDLAR